MAVWTGILVMMSIRSLCLWGDADNANRRSALAEEIDGNGQAVSRAPRPDTAFHFRQFNTYGTDRQMTHAKLARK